MFSTEQVRYLSIRTLSSFNKTPPAFATANQVTIKRFASLPPQYRQTLTRDRGSENLGYQELEKVLGIKCYFAHPYHSWERGASENLNGLIRRFLPKGTDFATVSDTQIKHIEYLLKSRPRK